MNKRASKEASNIFERRRWLDRKMNNNDNKCFCQISIVKLDSVSTCFMNFDDGDHFQYLTKLKLEGLSHDFLIQNFLL